MFLESVLINDKATVSTWKDFRVVAFCSRFQFTTPRENIDIVHVSADGPRKKMTESKIVKTSLLERLTTFKKWKKIDVPITLPTKHHGAILLKLNFEERKKDGYYYYLRLSERVTCFRFREPIETYVCMSDDCKSPEDYAILRSGNYMLFNNATNTVIAPPPGYGGGNNVFKTYRSHMVTILDHSPEKEFDHSIDDVTLDMLRDFLDAFSPYLKC